MRWVLIRLSFTFFICGIFSYQLLGQSSRRPGLLLDSKQYQRDPTLQDSGSKSDNIPLDGYSLKSYAPIPGDQGDKASCVGWAVAYGSMTIMQALDQGLKDKNQVSEKAFSPMYIYNQTNNGTCDKLITITEAMKLLETNGICSKKRFDPSDCASIPTNSLIQQSRRYKISSYKTIFKYNAAAKEKILMTKRMVAGNRPVVVGMAIPWNFYEVPRGTKVWNPRKGNQDFWGAHAMVVVGYDEGLKAFELLNSWGQDWGNDGYIYIGYEDFAEYCTQGYILELGRQGFGSPVIIGVELNLYARGTIDDIKDKELSPVSFEDGIYKPQRSSYIGDLFQLELKSTQKGQFIYVLSLDAKGKVTAHYPPPIGIDTLTGEEVLLLEDFYESMQKHKHTIPKVKSPYFYSVNQEVMLPSEDNALGLREEGDEYIAILVSDCEIPDFYQLLKEVYRSSGSLLRRLSLSLGDSLLSPHTIDYHPDRLGFTSKPIRNKVIPLMIKMRVEK